jgi:hypothetical protein
MVPHIKKVLGFLKNLLNLTIIAIKKIPIIILYGEISLASFILITNILQINNIDIINYFNILNINTHNTPSTVNSSTNIVNSGNSNQFESLIVNTPELFELVNPFYTKAVQNCFFHKLIFNDFFSYYSSVEDKIIYKYNINHNHGFRVFRNWKYDAEYLKYNNTNYNNIRPFLS